jgi:hypothetical protein
MTFTFACCSGCFVFWLVYSHYFRIRRHVRNSTKQVSTFIQHLFLESTVLIYPGGGGDINTSIYLFPGVIPRKIPRGLWYIFLLSVRLALSSLWLSSVQFLDPRLLPSVVSTPMVLPGVWLVAITLSRCCLYSLSDVQSMDGRRGTSRCVCSVVYTHELTVLYFEWFFLLIFQHAQLHSNTTCFALLKLWFYNKLLHLIIADCGEDSLKRQ